MRQLFDESTRTQDDDTPVGGESKKVPISADDVLGLGSQGTGKEFVIIRISTDRFREGRGGDEGCMRRNQVQRRTKINTGCPHRKPLANAHVFFKNLPGHRNFKRPISPVREHLTWRPSEEHGRNEDIGVENDSHRERTAFMAAVMSDLRRPASRAARRALAMRELNSSREGAVIGFSTMASASPTTTNRTPGLRLIR